MKRERWREVEAALDRVLDAPDSAREAALDEACGEDAELRREVIACLAAGDAPAFFDVDAVAFAAPVLHGHESGGRELPAEKLGNYRLVKQIGAGGMSRVYLARREGAEFEQEVAVKILRAIGLDLAEEAARFRAERQILASLDHPSIARVFDGGTTESGLPYLVMELIDGVPITEHCAKLGLDECLGLVIEASRAVHYAHQRLIVHRDLKPSNILVTETGRLKLLDFGIAKLLDPKILAPDLATPVTRTGFLLMTPEYAAPEQVSGQEVTTATDVYALGVLLYELLTGRRPFQLDGLSPSRIEEAVCTKEPRKPSTVVREIEAGGPRRRDFGLEGDLDTIVLKALRKAPGERYDSALALAEDLSRFQRGLPIAARPATVRYRLRKFVGRHRWSVAAGVAAFLSLALFGAAMIWQHGVTRRERDRALLAEAQSSAINRFLVDEMLGSAAPEVAQGREVSVLATAARRIEGSFPDQPALEASVRRTLGELSLRLGQLSEAESHLARAHELFAATSGPEHPDTLVAARLLAELALAQGRYDDAEREVTEIAASQRLALGLGHPELWESSGLLARVELEKGDYAAAESRIERLLESSAGAGVPPESRIELEAILAEVYARQRRWAKVQSTAARVLAAQRELLGPNHPALARTLATLGNAQTRNKRYVEAQASLKESLALRQRVLGEEHPETLDSLRALVVHYADFEDLAAARRYARMNAELSHRVYGRNHPRAIRADENLGVLHSREGRADLSVPIYLDTARRYEATLGIDHPSTIRSLRNLNGALMDLDRVDDARAVARKILAAGRARIDAGSDDATFLSDFAWFLVTCRPEDLRDAAEALPLAERAVELSGGEWDDAYDTLGRVYFELGDVARAIELQQKALTFPTAVASMDSERHLIEYLEANGELERVEAELRLLLERRRATRASDEPILGTSHRRLGQNLQKRGLLEPARVELQLAVDQFGKTLPPDDFQLLRARSELGEVLMRLGRLDEAEPHLLAAGEGLYGRIWFRDETTKFRSQDRVAELYRNRGRPRLAEKWAARAAGDSGPTDPTDPTEPPGPPGP